MLMAVRCLRPWVTFACALALCAVAHADLVTETLRIPLTEWWIGGPAVNAADGSIWITDRRAGQLVHFSENGAEVWRGGSFLNPAAVSVNSTDGSCWVTDSGRNQVVHVSRDGEEMWRGATSDFPMLIAVNPTDGSCWVGTAEGQLLHLASDGTQLADLRGLAYRASSLSVNHTDGSCWFVKFSQGEGDSSPVVHVDAAGRELWRGDQYRASGVSVNASDGSCWVTTSVGLVHLAADGSELRREGTFWMSLLVNPTNGRCWALDGLTNEVVLLSADGSRRLWSVPFTVGELESLAVNPTDGSCWVVETGGEAELVHLTVNCTPFDDVTCEQWAAKEIEACWEAGIVKGYTEDFYRPADSVTRDQMAVFISRALAGGDEHVPTGPATPSFKDVPADHWAYRYVEYAAGHKVVEGYERGMYQPDTVVDRGQMAVFIARALVSPLGDAGLLGYFPPLAPSFSDVQPRFWAYKYIEYIKSRGVVTGYPDRLYHPEYDCTRDQLAVYVARAFQLQ